MTKEIKIIIGIASALALSGGVYYYLTKEKDEKSNDKEESTTDKPAKKEKEKSTKVAEEPKKKSEVETLFEKRIELEKTKNNTAEWKAKFKKVDERLRQLGLGFYVDKDQHRYILKKGNKLLLETPFDK